MQSMAYVLQKNNNPFLQAINEKNEMKDSPTKKTFFLITVDTETFLANGNLLPFETNIYGDISGTEFGVNRIMDICEKYSARATFFVDVYMYHRYGKDKVSTLCKIIDERGHDVQLHAHTSWLPNFPREFVSSYELQDQIAIIAEGTPTYRRMDRQETHCL